jgi:hypothetical protein
VGQYTDGATDTQPGFVYKGSSYKTLNPVANPFAVVNAQSVNNEGEVAGFYSTDGVHQHGFLYNDVTNTYELLPDPNIANLQLTQFLGINDQGLAVWILPDERWQPARVHFQHQQRQLFSSG